NCIVEKTYSCLDCGLSNAKKEQTTVTKSHNWIALEKGGQVCNGCWHLESDPAYEVERNMRLSSAAGERAAVYFNVDANGDPINKQPDRYVFKTDDITILGAIGNCYLIEYPITVNARAGGATNSGFINKNCLSIIIKLNDITISDGIYSQYDNKYYVPVDQAVRALGGSFQWKSNEAFMITIKNALNDKEFTADIDMKGVAGSNVNFYQNSAVKYILWASKRCDRDIVIELDKFARLICGAEKVSETEYVIKDETDLRTKISELYEYFNLVAGYDFKYDGIFDKILLQGGLAAVVNEAENVIDAFNGELSNGDEIVQQLVLQLLGAKEAKFAEDVSLIYTCKEQISGWYSVLLKNPLQELKFMQLFSEIADLPYDEFHKKFVLEAKYDSDDIVLAKKTSKALEELLKKYGFEDVLDMQAIQNLRTLSELCEITEIMNILSLISAPISDAYSHNKWLSDIFENHYEEIISELNMLLEASNDPRMKRSLQNMIRDIENQKAAFNPFKDGLYAVENLPEIKQACDYIIKLGTHGVFGKKFMEKAKDIKEKAKINKELGKINVLQGIVAADEFLSMPSKVAALLGSNPSLVYQKLSQAEVIGESLSKQAAIVNSLTYRDPEYRSQLTYCVYFTRTALTMLLEASKAEAHIFDNNEKNIKEIQKTNDDFEILVSEVYSLLEKSGY
ncbi:MAG: hypothetical protein IKM00_05265, partial [Clostridia bacterium]|nr:hypothetical protein [Clostridia bacterium]